MSTLLLLAWIGAPAVAAPLLFHGGWPGRWTRAVAPWAALPVLILAVAPIAYPLAELDWLLFGARLELDSVGRIFLIVAAFLWTTAGVYARGYVEETGRPRFLFFFLMTMTGNLGMPLAADAISFFVFFALMTFAAYGLIVHAGDAKARRAGHVYLVLAVIGEVFLLIGMVIAVSATGEIGLAAIPAGSAGSARVGTITLCLLLGFGIKAGAVPLHVWLPLAHPVAPTPASAVLSGCMIKAGLLGWLRFLPLGEVAQPGWGSFWMALGIAAAFFGVVVGVFQSDPKTVLAYSSVSQMGLMNAGIGLGLAVPAAAPAVIAAVTLYGAHHGLAKGALFLSTGVVDADSNDWRGRALVGLGVLLPAAALAGAPLTSGSLAKSELKAVVQLSPLPMRDWLESLLPIAAGATTLLMLHFLILLWRRAKEPTTNGAPPIRVWGAWAALAAGGVIVPRFLYFAYPLDPMVGIRPMEFASAALDLLPIIGGVVAFGGALLGWRKFAGPRPRPSIAPGDILGPVESVIRRSWRRIGPLPAIPDNGLTAVVASAWYRLFSESRRSDRLILMELALTRWPAGVAIVVLLSTAVFILFLRA